LEEPSAAVKPLTSRERSKIKGMLLDQREKLNGHVNSLKNDALRRNDPVNPEEDGTEEFDRDFALQLATSGNRTLLEIDDALQRIESGAYGVCEHCGDTVARTRLQAVPFVKTCIRCQSEIEKGGILN